MSARQSSYFPDDDPRLPTSRELVAPLFRYRRAVLVTFAFLMTAVVTAAALAPTWFEADMKFLVKRERVDPVLTPTDQSTVGRVEVTEAEVYSEIQLLKSRDLLKQVAIATKLYTPADTTTQGVAGADTRSAEARLADAADALNRDLVVEPVRKTTMIRVAYRSADPSLAANVLERLASLYLDKHLALRRPPGQFEFFTQQANRSAQELHAAQAQLLAFSTGEHVVVASSQREDALKTLAEFETSLEQTRAEVAESNRRLVAIASELEGTPDRQLTQIRNAGDMDEVRRLQSQILDRTIKRDDMLRLFTPVYPPVVQLEAEIAQRTAALQAIENAPLRDETTDQNPTHQWLRTEAARVRTGRDALETRVAAIRQIVDVYRQRAHHLDSLNVQQQELTRTAQIAEANQLLYEKKREEARISDALDRTRIANVALVEAPVVPRSPRSQRLPIVVLGSLLALLVSMGIAYVSHAVNPSFRTPDEVRRVMDVPVLAILPEGVDVLGPSNARSLLRVPTNRGLS